jgi:hypothetical protein
VVEIHVFWRNNPSINVKERIPEELGTRTILAIHRDRTPGVGEALH